MSDPARPKPTHVLIGHFVTGQPFVYSWRETRDVIEGPDGFSDGDKLETCTVTETDISIRMEDGGVVWINKGHVTGYQLSPYKELPDSVKLKLEEAKNRPSPNESRRTH